MKYKNVRIFVSSTFNDMHAERDYLVKNVFPALSEWCEKRKLRLIDVDLRWGVSTADSEAKNTVMACLRNIDECRPFFLCFLGQRRGRVKDVDDINSNTYKLFPKLKNCLPASVTELEILHALIDPLHNGTFKDNNERKGNPTEFAFFFLRDEEYLEKLPHKDLALTYTNEAEKDKSKADEILKNWREEKIPEQRCSCHRYSAEWRLYESTPEIELPYEVSTTARKNSTDWKRAHEHWKKRWEIAGVSVNGSGTIKKGTEQRQQAEAYNKSFTHGRLGDFSVKGNILSDFIFKQLANAIEEHYKEHISIVEKTPQTALQNELDQQEQFLQIVNEGFVERKGDFDAINEYINNDESRPFLLTALAGMGKTSLLAHFIDEYKPERNETLYYRFVGGSNDSVSVERLFQSLLKQMKESGKIKNIIPTGYTDMMNKLPELLAEAGKNGKTILVIDALNQLESGMDGLYWIPAALPENIKLIVSIKLGEDSADEFYKKQKKNEAMIFHSVKSFDEPDRKALIDNYLEQYFKELEEDQIATLISSEGAENPLYLKAILSELRVFGVRHDLSKIISERFKNTPVSVFNAILERMESDPAYSTLKPAVALPHIFAWIAHSRSGMKVEELVELLIREKLTDNETEAREVIYLILRQLRPYLAKRDGRVDFLYESFKDAATQRYTSKHSHSRPAADWHKSLAEYFETFPYFDDDERKTPNARKATELAYQWRNASEEGFLRTVFAFDWMDAVQKIFGVDFMLNEINNMPASTPEWFLSAKKAIELSSHIIRSDSIGASQLFGDRNAEFSDMLKGSQKSMADQFKQLLRSIGGSNFQEMGKNHLVEHLFFRLGCDKRAGMTAFLADAASTKRSKWLRSLFARQTSSLDEALISSYHMGGVPLALRVTKDGRFAVVCEFKSVRVCDLHLNRTLMVFNIPAGYLPAEAFISNDAKLVAANVVDGIERWGVFVWDAISGKTLFTQIDEKKDWQWNVINLGDQNCVEFFVRRKGLEYPYLLAFHPKEKSLFCMDTSVYDCCPDLKYLEKYFKDNGIDFATRAVARETWTYKRYCLFNGLSFTHQSVNSVSYCGDRVEYDATRRAVKLKKSNSYGEVVLGTHSADLTNVALSVNAKIAASCSHDRTVMLYSVADEKIIGCLNGFSGNPICVALDGTGENLFVSINDGSIQGYDTKKISLQKTTDSAPHIGSILLGGIGYTFSGDMITCGEDGYIKKWNPKTGKCFFTSAKITPQPGAFTVAPDGLLMAYCSDEYCVVLDTKNNTELYRKHIGKIVPYEMRLTDKVVFIATRDGNLIRYFYRKKYFWQRELISEHIGDGTIQSSILFDDNKGVFAMRNTSSVKRKIHLYNLSGKELKKPICIEKVYNSGVRLSDGTFVFSTLGGLDFLSPSGTIVRTISTPVMSDHILMAYSPHSHLIAAVSLDQILRVWDINAEKGKELLAVFGGGILFASITFSPDGKQVIAADQSGLLTWFDVVHPAV